ncbi:MAG: pyruvate kinase [Pseudohongiellaceae bacterium]
MTDAPRHTKIVCTMGPASSTPDRIKALISAGMDVARLNFSHGSHEDHREVVALLRECAQAQGRNIPVLLDLQGPKIRVGAMQDGEQHIEEESLVQLTPDAVQGTSTLIPIDYDALAKDVREGDRILMDDGLLEFRIEAIDEGSIMARTVVGGLLKSRKGVNLPNVKTSVSAITEKDVEDLHFGVELGVDFVAMSFVRNADDVRELIRRMTALGTDAAVIAKIEKPEALDDIDDIIAESGGIMVARGDLGIEIESERVPLIQKDLIGRCRRAGKPVITATQLLESMIEHPRPTRAESSDVANAVLDGTDAVMLSGETAVGRYPVQAVQTLDRICRSVESGSDHIYYGLGFVRPRHDEKQIIESLSYSTVIMAREVGARVIATITHSGMTAKRIAKYRPAMPIIAFTESDEVLRQLNLVWGVTCIKLEQLFDTDRSVRLMEDYLKDHGHVIPGDRVVLATGIPVAKRGRTNMVTINTVNG